MSSVFIKPEIMKAGGAILLGLISLYGAATAQPGEKITREQQTKLNMLKTEVKTDLTKNILPYWIDRMTDKVNGGFYGRADYLDKIYPDAEKGGILNARILWTFSSAWRILHDTAYLNSATRAKDYILTHFIDNRYGGAYMSLDAKGEPADTRKQVYTESFFIYALAEYSRATGDIESLKKAMDIFDAVEKYAADRDGNGYFEVFSRDWKRLPDRLIGESSPKDEKTMNTHLHIMEAYANLYRVSGDKVVGARLRNLVEIFLDKIIDRKSSHLICFLDRKWNSTSDVDSYGHDIESSWLLLEATALLGDKELLARVKETCIKVANAGDEGIRPDGGMITEKDNSTGRIRTGRSWWEQAETVVGNLNAFELTGDQIYLDRSLNCWEYIKKYFVDNRNGGWYSGVSDTGEPGRGDKAGFWVCPYHNGRMCMEVIERVKD